MTTKSSVLLHLHHPAARTLHLHPAAARTARCSRAECKDWQFDIDTSSLIEFHRSLDGLALFKRMLEVAEHDMEARWRERDGFSWLDFKARPLQGAFS